MPSPFPGMDPYLESWIWGDFHSNLISALGAQLNAKLPRRYIARLYIRPEDPSERRSLRIVNIAQKRVVTEIEVVSPSDKTPHDSGDAHRFKHGGDIASRVNFVEIDLLRSGVRPSLGGITPPTADYYILACRATEWPQLAIWPISVRDPLPLIRVPLGFDELDGLLDLRTSLDRVYDENRYTEQLDYTRPPAPPLREPDASWARELLASRLNPPPSA